MNRGVNKSRLLALLLVIFGGGVWELFTRAPVTAPEPSVFSVSASKNPNFELEQLELQLNSISPVLELLVVEDIIFEEVLNIDSEGL